LYLYMDNISTDPHCQCGPQAIGTERGRQLYQAMRAVGLEATAWAMEFIARSIYSACLVVAKDLQDDIRYKSYGSKKEVRLWYKGMIGYLVEKLEEEEGDVSCSTESVLDKETQTDGENQM
jgi:hypothetical protein